MPTTLQPKILLLTLKYDFKVMQRENSPNVVQKWYPKFFRGTIDNPACNPIYKYITYILVQ